MGFQFPGDPTQCIEEELKNCLQIYHCSQMFLDCYRDGCWEHGDEINQDRCAVNMYTISDKPDTQKLDTFADCQWIEQAYVARIRFEIHAIHCIGKERFNGAQMQARLCWRLLYARLCHCWRNKKEFNMLWDNFEFVGSELDFRNDPAEAERGYAVIVAEFDAYYRGDPCNPGTILVSC